MGPSSVGAQNRQLPGTMGPSSGPDRQLPGTLGPRSGPDRHLPGSLGPSSGPENNGDPRVRVQQIMKYAMHHITASIILNISGNKI